jgi:hypothetical protein
MAGVPDVSVWTSLKKCGAEGCQTTIGERYLRALIERRHKRLARMLSNLSPGDILGFIQALRDYDFRDHRLFLGSNRALRLEEIWKVGEADVNFCGSSRNRTISFRA